ncbi:putative quorum-sensing-regulated virulence factor [Candidatus Sulfurimonas baltica]|uniref:DUF3820 family protein n=1 Tax=Candidatus Sulfurimonas baltica TaxID=2740404 RepID=A0A7S7LXD5_9BACT|nr:DUF3820 family protein [Candidatus Sulfurimonas baltica]QOY53274.1 DUF3820 family protein [Candidatus Sulfurimonas baltica]
MAKPHFIFTKYTNSFSVHVDNLEQLSVQQIQQIEAFVSERNGIFDFNTYTFVIKKRLEFNEFILLLEHILLEAVCEEKILKIQQKSKVEFGKFKGMFYSDIPDAYLLWLKSNYRGKDRSIIEAEVSFRSI